MSNRPNYVYHRVIVVRCAVRTLTNGNFLLSHILGFISTASKGSAAYSCLNIERSTTPSTSCKNARRLVRRSSLSHISPCLHVKPLKIDSVIRNGARCLQVLRSHHHNETPTYCNLLRTEKNGYKKERSSQKFAIFLIRLTGRPSITVWRSADDSQ